MKIEFTNGNAELIDTIQPFWEQLNEYHEQVSAYFSEDFHKNTFEQRKAKLLNRYKNEQIRFDLAYYENNLIGYCISGVSDDGIGEIESIFVGEEFRSLGVGDSLMRCALDWLNDKGVTTKVIDVAVGNERAYRFYARYGFYPRVTTLKQKILDSP